MSWQLGAVLVLAGVLVAGFAWYERSRPPSRVVALVAVLAALAVAGRVALAPIPNVVATTDIALLAGYSLGAAPGFAVGSLAGLVSNFWLGQGPWTLWQMIAWGGVGVCGALLARVSARRLGRFGLALAAAVAGLAYGAFLDLSVMVNFGGEQSLDRYLALSARGIPFNVAHAVGNAALMLVAGPALVSMLTRFKERSTVTWRERKPDPPHPGPGGPRQGRPARGIGAAGVALAALVLVAAAVPDRAGAGTAAAERWLERAQRPDGGFGVAPKEASSVEMTGWAALGLEAADRNPADVGSPSSLHYLRARTGELSSTGDLERTILAVTAAGANPRGFGGRDLVTELESRRRGNGSWEGQVNLTAFGILALRAAGLDRSSVGDPARWLVRAANEDGGWGSRSGSASEPDSTGAVLQALAAAPGKVDDGDSRRGVRYLEGAQRGSGGWSLTTGAEPNSQSTAWAIQGLTAAGVDPRRVGRNGNSGLDYLDARQASDGHYRYSRGSDQTPVWVTAQALLAVHSKPFPLGAVPRVETQQAASDETTKGQQPDSDGAPARGGKRREAAGGSQKPAEPDGGDGGRGGDATGEIGGEQIASQGEETRPGASVASEAGPQDGAGLLLWVGLGSLALLAAALGAGLPWYRRRLP